jgi:hypothetical protein
MVSKEHKMSHSEYSKLSRMEKAEYHLERNGWVFEGASGIAGRYFSKGVDKAYVTSGGKIDYL